MFISFSSILQDYLLKNFPSFSFIGFTKYINVNDAKSFFYHCKHSSISLLIVFSLLLLVGCFGEKKQRDPIKNSYLDVASEENKVSNYLIRPHRIVNTRFGTAHGNGHDIIEVTYGTINEITGKTAYSISKDFVEGKFIAAEGSAKSDNSKNNILRIKTGTTEQQATNNYYYSHLNGKPFTQFLPAINKLEILGLNTALANNQKPNTDIFSSFDASGHYSIAVYTNLKNYIKKAANHTFKGFALVRFTNHVNPQTAGAYVINEDSFYPAKFALTFNSDLGVDETLTGRFDDNFYSMKITINKELDAVTDLPTAGTANASAVKPKISTIELKNFKFLGGTGSYAKSYPALGNLATDWSSADYFTNLLAFSQNEDKINQIAGSLLLERIVSSNLVQYLGITFASNEVCKVGAGGCSKVVLKE